MHVSKHLSPFWLHTVNTKNKKQTWIEGKYRLPGTLRDLCKCCESRPLRACLFPFPWHRFLPLINGRQAALGCVAVRVTCCGRLGPQCLGFYLFTMLLVAFSRLFMTYGPDSPWNGWNRSVQSRGCLRTVDGVQANWVCIPYNETQWGTMRLGHCALRVTVTDTRMERQ